MPFGGKESPERTEVRRNPAIKAAGRFVRQGMWPVSPLAQNWEIALASLKQVRNRTLRGLPSSRSQTSPLSLHGPGPFLRIRQPLAFRPGFDTMSGPQGAASWK
jgi:hypothetical protein